MLLLAGCGGGGGGSSPSSPPTGFRLTQANAVQAARLTLRPIEEVNVLADVLRTAADVLSGGSTHYEGTCDGAPVTFDYTDADGNLMLSNGDTLTANHGSCLGVARRISISVSRANGPTGELAGRAEFSVDTDSGEHLSGSFTLASTYTASTRRLTSSITSVTVTLTAAGMSAEITNAAIDQRFENFATYDLAFSGQVDSTSLGGSYSFSTPTHVSGAWGSPPNAGQLLLTAGSTRARFAVNTPAGAELLFQVDQGSGYSPPTTAKWRDLLRGQIFEWYPNDPPSISELEILPTQPDADDTLTASVVASDPDGSQLFYAYEWRVNGNPYSFSDTLAQGTFHRGDTVTLTVTVSDSTAQEMMTTSVVIGNAAPHVTSLVVSPSSPRSIDDLTMTATAADTDGDAFQYRFEWRKNGGVIAGETGTVLTHSAFARGDSVTAAVFVTDAADTGSDEVTVLIGDSPPQVIVTGAPEIVHPGVPVAFDAEVVDPDGDALPALQFELHHGPAGMTVDPVTGTVSWIPKGPLFDIVTTVHWSIGVSVPGGGEAFGQVIVEDDARSYPLARSSVDAPLQSGLKIGDFDGDGDTEILVLSQRSLFELERSGAGYRQSWMYPFDFFVNQPATSVEAVDIDGDHQQELFVSAGILLTRLAGDTRRATSILVLPSNDSRWSCVSLQAADLDGDGSVELVCHLAPAGNGGGTTDKIVLIDPRAMSVIAELPPDSYGANVRIGNVDTDPALEIVTSNGLVIDGSTLAVEWRFDPGFGTELSIGDLTGDGVGEILALKANIYRVYSALPSVRAALFDVTAAPFTSTALVADVLGDAAPEIIIASTHLAAYQYDVASNTATLVSDLPLPGSGAETLALANVDEDPEPEFITGSYFDALTIGDYSSGNARIEWSSFDADPATLNGPFFGGELARSSVDPPRPLFLAPLSGQSGTRVFSLDPVSGDFGHRPELEQSRSYSTYAALTVTDYDHDGVDEAFLAATDYYSAYYAAYDFFAGSFEFRSEGFFQDPVMDVVHADLNGDGRDDLIGISSNGIVSAYDVFNGQLIWRSPQLASGRAVEVADLNGSGGPEIIVATTRNALVFSRDANPALPYVQIASSTPTVFPTIARDLAVADVDGDGVLEIFLLTVGLGSDIQRFDNNLQLTASLHLDWSGETLSLEESAFARKNLLLSGIQNGGTYTIRAIDPRYGREVWRSPDLHGAPTRNSIHLIDLAGDGNLRLSYGTDFGVFLTR